MIKIGIPGALLVFCLSVRGIVINRLLLQYSGNDGLSAMSAFNMIRGIFIAYCLGNGSIIRMLIRVSDEIDVVATRNPLVMYDIDTLTDEIEIVENRKLESIRSMRMTANAFSLSCKTDDENIFSELQIMVGKMQKTLDYCKDVTSKRSEFEIRQSKVILKRL